MKRAFLGSLALTLCVAGLAGGAPRSLTLTDEFGSAIAGASVSVVSMASPDGNRLTSGTSGGGQQLAVELAGGGYLLPEVSGPALITVSHPTLGTVQTKAALAAGQPLDLVLSYDAGGRPMLRTPGSMAAATSLAGPGAPRVGGDTCALATVIQWSSILVPGGYTDAGVTGTGDNAPVICGINGSDVFYTFTAGATLNLDMTTCWGGPASPSDTVLQVKTGSCAALVTQLCNDDSCTVPPGGNIFNSTLSNVPVTNTVQYTVQIDNWASTASGAYTFHIQLPFALDSCPADGIPENEPNCGLAAPPACAANDFTNGGCNATPNLFSPLSCGDTICGTYGNCGTTRDTDWYKLVIAPGQLEVATWCAIGEGPTLLGRVDNGGIDSCVGVTAFAEFRAVGSGAEGCVSALLYPGTWYYFVATSNFAGTPCGADYQATLDCVSACCGDTPGSTASTAFTGRADLGGRAR